MRSPIRKKDKAAVSSAPSVVVHDDGRRDIPVGPALDIINDDYGVIQIGKKKYAVDLFRSRMPEIAIKEEAKLIKPIGRAETWNLYTHIPNNRVAFGSAGVGHKKGHLPLAESIRRDLMGDDWIVVIRLDGDKHWIGRMKGGEVIGDEVFTDPQLAYDEIIGERASREHPIIAPAKWGIPGSMEVRLSDIIGQKTAPLRNFGFIANNLARILFLMLILGIGGSAYYYFKVLADRRIAEERDLEERRKKRIVVADTDYPWFQAVRPEEFITACARLFNESLRTVPGWTGQSPVCQYADGKVVATLGYVREDDGRIAWMRNAYDGASGQVSMDAIGNTASYTVSEELLAPKEGFRKIKPWSNENIQRVLVERFQNLGLHPKIVAKASKTPEEAQDRAIFNSHSLSIGTNVLPMDIARLMSDIPATVPQSLVWDQNTNQWTLDVTVYHEPILPLGAI